jgi:hypothetical protein
MEPLNELHTSHVGRVNVSFYLSASDLNPQEVTMGANILPALSAKRGDERRNYAGQLISPHKEGFWMVTSKMQIHSKDLNEHFLHLLNILLPKKDYFLLLLKDLNGSAYFDVLWESSYLHAGTGPILSAEVINGVSQLNAAMGFDIYQIDE